MDDLPRFGADMLSTSLSDRALAAIGLLVIAALLIFVGVVIGLALA